MQNKQHYAKATLGGGCFWCLETVFDQVQGILSVESGYAGGTVMNPTYREVCSGHTGHAEVVQITFDPSVIRYRNLLDILFDIHDPTTLNRQGADVGTQYRSVIFYHDAQQQAVAEDIIAELSAAKRWREPIVTQVVPFEVFYEAEDYHQEYYDHNKSQPYCQVVITPKVRKFQKHFTAILKAKL